MLDRKYIKAAEHVDRKVSASSPAIVEGAFLAEIVEAGEAKVILVASVAGTEKIAGIAVLPFQLPGEAVENEEFKVSSTSLIMNLRYNNVITSTARAEVVGSTDLTVDESSFSSTPSTGTVKLDIAGGRIKFAAGDAGKVVHFHYRHSLTVVQSTQKYGERALNNRNLVGTLAMVSVMKGYCEISTDQYDPAVNWAAPGTNKILLAANGKITLGSSGVEIPGSRVISAPDLSGSAQGSFLRISCLIP